MKGADDSVVGEIIDSLPGLDAIRDEYIELFQRARNPSFFCSFQFVRTAWVNFHGRRDRLFVLAVREAEKLVGIAPFIIEPEMLLPKVPFRVIKFVAEWGDGDKPRLVTTQDEAWMWTRIQELLTRDFTAWDAIALDEQPIDSHFSAAGAFRGAGFSLRRSSGIRSYRAAIGGEWKDYVAGLKGKVRGDWTRCRRRLSEHAQPMSFECFEGAEEIGAALERYVALEQTTWKGGASFSIGGAFQQLRFYRALVRELAPAGMVAICFLTSGGADAAAALVFRTRDVVYGAHICYDPSLSKFAPGVVLNAEVMRRHFGSHYAFFDFLALQGGDTDSRFKANWATEVEDLTEIRIVKPGLRSRLYGLDQKLRSWREGRAKRVE